MMNSKLYRGGLAALLATISICGAVAQKTWTPVSSSAGKFTILMPGKATFSTRKISTQAGQVDLNAYTVPYGQSAFLVTYSDYPASMMKKSDAKTVLKGAMSGAVGDGQLKHEEWTKVQGYSAVVFSALKEKSGSGYKWRYVEAAVLAKNRLYQIMIIQPTSDNSTVDVKKYFDSFKITG